MKILFLAIHARLWRNHVPGIEMCIKCHGLWFWMLTGHNALDARQFCSFDIPALHASPTQELDTTFILPEYVHCFLSLMVGWPYVLKGPLFNSRMIKKRISPTNMKVTTEYRRTERETCPSVILTATNSRWNALEANPGLRCEKQQMTAWSKIQTAL